MNIIERCLAVEESTRPPLDLVLEHAWVRGEEFLENEVQGQDVDEQNSQEVENNAQITQKHSETSRSICAWLMNWFTRPLN